MNPICGNAVALDAEVARRTRRWLFNGTPPQRRVAQVTGCELKDRDVGRRRNEILAGRQNQPARGRFHPKASGWSPLCWVEQASGLLRRASRAPQARGADGLARFLKAHAAAAIRATSPHIGGCELPTEILRACARQGVVPTRCILAVNIGDQTTSLYERNGAQHGNGAPPSRHYRVVETFRCSTSRYGIGEIAGSNKTPRGLHRIAEKFGGGWPVGTVFKGRKMVGFTWGGMPFAPIASRLFWLEGLEPGLNRGGNVDSHDRYIYIHGTANQTTLGRPDSKGCVHLAADDLIPLYDKLPVATLVWIAER